MKKNNSSSQQLNASLKNKSKNFSLEEVAKSLNEIGKAKVKIIVLDKQKKTVLEEKCEINKTSNLAISVKDVKETIKKVLFFKSIETEKLVANINNNSRYKTNVEIFITVVI